VHYIKQKEEFCLYVFISPECSQSSFLSLSLSKFVQNYIEIFRAANQVYS